MDGLPDGFWDPCSCLGNSFREVIIFGVFVLVILVEIDSCNCCGYNLKIFITPVLKRDAYSIFMPLMIFSYAWFVSFKAQSFLFKRK